MSPLTLRPSDVIIAPEYLMPEAMEAFPKQKVCVFVQNPFSFMEAFQRARSRGIDAKARSHWFFGVSEICMRQFELLEIDRASWFPVSMKPEEFSWDAEKERLITYMPRKRPSEAAIMDAALRARGRISGYRLEAIDGLPRKVIAERLQKSRFFISLQKHESIGFPAAEAMAASCVTVGYTGLGGNEYFDQTTGIPVPEDDLAALVHAVEDAVLEYEADPQRLDALRSHAATVIRSRYSQDSFKKHLLWVWDQLDASLG